MKKVFGSQKLATGAAILPEVLRSSQRRVLMSWALSVPGRPSAPQNGLYVPMENNNFKQRFKNQLRIEILSVFAYMVDPRSRPKKSYTLKLTPADDCCIIGWTPVNDTWQTARLQFVCAEGIPALLEDSDKFWKEKGPRRDEGRAQRDARRERQSRSR